MEATVLLVDDAFVREVSSLALRGAEFEVLTAADGLEALRICREHSGRIDLILLNLTMPGLSGEETFRRRRAQGAQQKIVLMDEYGSHDAIHRLLQGAPRISFPSHSRCTNCSAGCGTTFRDFTHPSRHNRANSRPRAV
ncbi:MAG: response regulator [Candidatus Didemnitutus sp.]|nr:response regulator [Candidatus Didemnitutus sp.]